MQSSPNGGDLMVVYPGTIHEKITPKNTSKINGVFPLSAPPFQYQKKQPGDDMNHPRKKQIQEIDFHWI